MNILSVTKLIILYLAVVDLVFWAIAITITVWGVNNGSMVETNPFYASLFDSQGLLVGAVVFCLTAFGPILLCFGAYAFSPKFIKRISIYLEEDSNWVAKVFQLTFFAVALTFLLIVAFIAVPDGINDLAVLLDVLGF